MNELRPKLFDVIKGYTKEQLIKDILSGIIVAIIALPLSIALAIASGVGPVQGLYTAIVAGFFISFFGGSRVQIGGPTAAFVVIIYGIADQHGMSAGSVLTTRFVRHFKVTDLSVSFDQTDLRDPIVHFDALDTSESDVSINA